MSTYIILIAMFIIFTAGFIVIVLIATNEKFSERFQEMLPFSPKEGEYQPPLPVIVFIIVVSMVLAYFF